MICNVVLDLKRSALVSACLALCLAGAARAADEKEVARRILEMAGVRGGVIVHLGCGDGRLTAALQTTATTLVQGLDTDARNVQAARQNVRAKGVYGPVSIDQYHGAQLPFVDNLVNLLVVENPGAVSRDEMLRVLAPGGVAWFADPQSQIPNPKLVKPRPGEIDDWTHYLHDPSNNAVAHDTAVGPPRHLQWVSGPAWSRHHDHMASLSALVSSNGRVFYIMDEGPRESILLPPQWSLIARDAFNGAILWKRSIAEWNTHLWPLKSGPNQLPRRLVAVGNHVYVTLGIDAPLEILDAATGQTVRTCLGTDHTDEVLAADNTLFLLVAHSPNKWKTYRPKFTFVWSNTNRANKEWAWDGEERSIMAIDAQSGSLRWKHESRVAPLTLAVDAQRVVFYDGEKVIGLDRKTGSQLWVSEPITRKAAFPTGYGPTLVLYDDVVLLSIESPSMTAFSARDGKTLWTNKHLRGGHASPDDMLVVQGLVWSADVANGANSGAVTGRDIHTGEIKSEFLPDVSPDWFHHRCYRSRATDKYFIASRTGIEFIDLEAKHWEINHWVRGGCLYGFMPANGLVYAPPHSCGCFLESKLVGLNALAAESPTRSVPADPPAEQRLERGPAYSSPPGAQPSTSSVSDWPTYRHDGARSGSVKTTVPAGLKREWDVKLDGRLSSVTVADGKLFVAAIDTHTVHALHATTGKPAWTYTAGGRVDSPPSVADGRVFFGSADGYVYSLRAADGQLAWRFRAAPADRRMMAYEQLESAWPVSGSVLIENGAVCFVAGRSAFLDGGMRLLRLDPLTGRLLSETRIDNHDPETGKDLQSQIKGQDMPVSLPDILSSDGKSIYMRSQAFDLQGVRRQIAPVKLAVGRRKAAAAEPSADTSEINNHLFSRSGFLDDSWFWRSYWMFGKSVDSNYGGWLIPGHFVPCGRLMVFDDACVYGFDRKPEYLCNASVAKYYVYRADREVTPEGIERVQAATRRINAASRDRGATSSDWATRKKFSLAVQNASTFHWAEDNLPIQARAMALAGDTLFVAGPPELLDEEEAFRDPDAPAVRAQLDAQVAALRGRKGAKLLALSAPDGRVRATYELGSPPTFDGMAAANNRLYLSTLDGHVLCLGSQGPPLSSAATSVLATIDTSTKPIADEPGRHSEPSLAGEFTHVQHAQVTKSDLGYHLLGEDDKLSVALKQLPVPLTGKVHLKARMRLTTDGNLRNGFLVFGNTAEDAKLVKCGLRLAMKKAMIIQGPSAGKGKPAQQPLTIEEDKTYEIDVVVDLPSRAVTMKVGGATVHATLDHPPASVTLAGFGVINAAADFSALEIAGP